MTPQEFIADFNTNARNIEYGWEEWGDALPDVEGIEDVESDESVIRKGTYSTNILSYDGNYYRITQASYGSDFSEWVYDQAEIEQVERHEMVTVVVEWVSVK